MDYNQQSFKVPQQHFSRDERYSQIIDVLSKQGRGVSLTTAQIGKRINMCKSPQLVGILADLCASNTIVCTWGKTINNLDVRLFSLNTKGE